MLLLLMMTMIIVMDVQVPMTCWQCSPAVQLIMRVQKGMMGDAVAVVGVTVAVRGRG
jgi:hypothetical protein